MATKLNRRSAEQALRNCTVVDPPLDALIAALRSYGASGELDVDNLTARYEQPFEPPYWRFLLETPAATLGEAPAAARRLAISAKAPDFARLGELTSLEAVLISNFHPRALASLAALPKLKCLALWSGPLASLQGFGSLKGLEHLIVYGASRLRSLDGLDELRSLKTLRLEGIPGVKRLDPLGALDQLQGLELNAGVQSGTLPDRTKFESLNPLRGLSSLKMLRMWGVRAEDDDLGPIAGLGPFEDIELPERTFPLEAMAAAAAAHPQLLRKWSEPLRTVVPCGRCGEKKAVLIGRGTRDVCSRCLPRNIEEFFAAFEARVEESRRKLR